MVYYIYQKTDCRLAAAAFLRQPGSIQERKQDLMSLPSIIKARRRELGLKLCDIAQHVGVSEATVQRWECGAIRTIKPGNLIKLAEAIKMPLSSLQKAAEPSNTMPVMPTGSMPVPVLGSVRAGWDGGVCAEHLGYIPAFGVGDPSEYAWLTVEGDSMLPLMRNGDHVLIHRQDYASSGDYIAAILGGDSATIKKFQKDSEGALLIPENPDYPYVFIPNDRLDELYIYGVAVRLERSLK